MNKPFTWFIKITNLPVQYFFYKKKIYYEGNDKKLKKIKGPALIISNHKSVYDYPLIMFTFFKNNIRTLIGETLFEHSKKFKRLLTRLGGIKVDRKSYNFDFLTKMSDCLKNGDVGLIFPEARLHTPTDPKGLLDFTPSYIYIALQNNVPIVPVYVNGIYGKDKKKYKDRARLIIGKHINLNNLIDKNKSEKENIELLNNYVKNYIDNLGKQLEEKINMERSKHE